LFDGEDSLAFEEVELFDIHDPFNGFEGCELFEQRDPELFGEEEAVALLLGRSLARLSEPE
jgi:hypothetical protein